MIISLEKVTKTLELISNLATYLPKKIFLFILLSKLDKTTPVKLLIKKYYL